MSFIQTNRLAISIFSIGVLILALHMRAIDLYWYWSFWWMDIMMHFLGGLLIGLIALLVSAHYKIQIRRMFLATLGVVLIVGIGWEIFEYVSGIFILEDPFPDTFYDLVMDTVGGIAAYLYATD